MNSLNTFLIAILFIFSTNAQVTVTTITEPFKGSGGLSLDTVGNLYIADFGDFLGIGDGDGQPNVISRLDQDLIMTEYATNFVGASGNDFDSNGVLYQSDIGVSTIYKIINGNRIFFSNTGIFNPVGLVFDSNDNMYVCNCGNNTIRKITPAGVSTLFSSGAIFSCPNGITIDENDNLYVSNFSNGNIIKITDDGATTLLNVTPGGSNGAPGNGHLDYHEGLRTLFIASMATSTIFYLNIDHTSDLEILAGTGVRGNDDGPASEATFSRPNGVAVTQSGDSIYINSAVPITDIPNIPLNPSLIRLITGVTDLLSSPDITSIEYPVKVYPNPVRDSFTLDVNMKEDFSFLHLSLYDIYGKKVEELSKIKTSNTKLNIQLDISNYSSGSYFYVINNGNKQLFNGRIIKQ